MNTLWNLVGSGLPVLFSLAAIPFIVRGLGTDRFGVLLLVWALIGYFGLVDLGIGRALTQITAERLGAGQARDVPSLVWSGLTLMAGLGALGGLILAGVAGLLVRELLAVPESYQEEAVLCLRVVALGLPLIVAASGLEATLAGYQEFPLINRLRIPFSAFNNLGQVLVAALWPNLAVVAVVLIVTRLLHSLVLLRICRRLAPLPTGVPLWKREPAIMLLHFGGWITVTNIVGPLMVYIDRFVIGTMLSMSAVAYYATPHEAVTRVLVVPAAIMGVLFPTFATVLQRDRERAVQLFKCGLATNLLLLLPPTVVLVAFAEPLLNLWLGPDFAMYSAHVLQVLAVAVMLNSLAHIPFALIQGAGRPDLTAKLHLAELLPYLAVLAYCTQTWGILGAALTWALRVTVDGWILAVLARRLLPELKQNHRQTIAIGVTLGAVLILLSMNLGVTVQIAVTTAALIGAPLMVWLWLLGSDERRLLIAMLPGRGV